MRQAACILFSLIVLVGGGLLLAFPSPQPSKESVVVRWKPEHGEMALEAIGKTDLIFANPPVHDWVELKYDEAESRVEQDRQLDKLLATPGVDKLYFDVPCEHFTVLYEPDEMGTVMTILCSHGIPLIDRLSEKSLKYRGPLLAVVHAELDDCKLVRSVSYPPNYGNYR